MRRFLSVACLALLSRAECLAQQQAQQQATAARNEFTYALSAVEDATFLGGRTVSEPLFQNRVLLEPSCLFHYRDRLTLGANVVGQAKTDVGTHSQLFVREAYVGLSAGNFDFTAGRRTAHWGVGYAFTAIGVVDPPIVATDPTDRLNLREGRDMIKADWVGGPHAVSVAWLTAALTGTQANLHDTGALRYNILLDRFDTSLIAGKDMDGDAFGGVAFTRVLGQAFEIHGELGWREHEALLVGGKYTTRSGITTIAEFYTPPNIAYYRSAALSAAAGRQRYAFLRVGKQRLRERPGWKQWDASGSLVDNLRDHSYTLVFDAERRFGSHWSTYLHAEAPGGGRVSEFGVIPYASASSFGIRFRQ